MVNPFDTIYSGLIKFLLILGLLGALWGTYEYKISQAYKQGVVTTEKNYDRKLLAEKERVLDARREAEDQLKNNFNKRIGEKDATIKALDIRVGALLSGVQSRPSVAANRNSSSPSTTTTTSKAGAYPAELYREYAEILINFARDADEIRIGLNQCYSDYDDVKKASEGLK